MGIEVQVKVYRFGNDGFVFKKDGSIILESWDFGLFFDSSSFGLVESNPLKCSLYGCSQK